MKCINTFNEYYYNQFTRLVNECRERNNTNLLNNYRRVCASIQKYPFPILSTQQALTMDGIGEATSRTFEKFIKMHKKKISDEAIDYVSLAFEINDPKNKKNKKGKKLKAESESGTDTNKNFIKKKPLKNVESFSANWTAALSIYLVYLQDKSLKIKLDEAQQMAQALIEELGSSGIKIQKYALKNIKELKDCGMVDSIDEKSSGVFISTNEFLIKWAKLEIKKRKIEIDVDDEGTLSFQIQVENKVDFDGNGKQINNIETNSNLNRNGNYFNGNSNNNFSNIESKNKSTDLNNLIISNRNKNFPSGSEDLINNNINNKNFESDASVNSIKHPNFNYNNIANANTNGSKNLVKNSNLDNFVNKSKANDTIYKNKKGVMINSTSNLKENMSVEDSDNSQILTEKRDRSPIKANPNSFNLRKNYKNETEDNLIIKNNINKDKSSNANNNKSNENDLLNNLNYIYENCDLNYNDFDFNTECSGYEAAYSQEIASKPKSFNNLENLGSKYSHLFSNNNNNNLNCIYEDSESKNNITHSNIEAENNINHYNNSSSNSKLKSFDERFKKNYEHLNNLIESSRKNSIVVDLSTLKKKKKNRHSQANADGSGTGKSKFSSGEKVFGQDINFDSVYTNNFDSNKNNDKIKNYNANNFESKTKFNFESSTKHAIINSCLTREEKINNFIKNYNPNINNNNINIPCVSDNELSLRESKQNNGINEVNKTNKIQNEKVTKNKINPFVFPDVQSENNNLEKIEKSSDERFRAYRKFLKSLKNESLSFNSNKNNINNICDSEDFESFSLNIKLLIDNRERGPRGEKLSDEIRCVNPEIPCEERVLAVGDFLWIYCDPHTETEYCLDFIIERKTLADLASSIKDGRYVEQKHRLKNTKINNVFYLFEGNSFNSAYNAVPKSAVFTAILNTFNIHDIGIIKTGTFEESLDRIDSLDSFIRHFYYTRKDTLDLFQIETFQDFMIKNAKTKNMSEENIFLKQLRCFDDCGAKSVEILKKAFKSPIQFYRLVQKIEDEDKKANLIDCMIYLAENNMDLSDKNVLNHLEPQNFRKIKKELKSIKKIRKNTNASIINFYS